MLGTSFTLLNISSRRPTDQDFYKTSIHRLKAYTSLWREILKRHSRCCIAFASPKR